jgi:hypothetical protein
LTDRFRPPARGRRAARGRRPGSRSSRTGRTPCRWPGAARRPRPSKGSTRPPGRTPLVPGRQRGVLREQDGRREPEAGPSWAASAEGDRRVVRDVRGDPVAVRSADERPHLRRRIGPGRRPPRPAPPARAARGTGRRRCAAPGSWTGRSSPGRRCRRRRTARSPLPAPGRRPRRRRSRLAAEPSVTRVTWAAQPA